MHRAIIDNLLEIRKNHAFGNKITTLTTRTPSASPVWEMKAPAFRRGCAHFNGEDGDKVMNVGKQHAGETWKEATGNVEETVSIDGGRQRPVSCPRRQCGRMDSGKRFYRTPGRKTEITQLLPAN